MCQCSHEIYLSPEALQVYQADVDQWTSDWLEQRPNYHPHLTEQFKTNLFLEGLLQVILENKVINLQPSFL